MNDNKNSYNTEIKHNICDIVSKDILELTEDELKTYIEFLKNVYDNRE